MKRYMVMVYYRNDTGYITKGCWDGIIYNRFNILEAYDALHRAFNNKDTAWAYLKEV